MTVITVDRHGELQALECVARQLERLPQFSLVEAREQALISHYDLGVIAATIVMLRHDVPALQGGEAA
jgi:hypothetical protein